MTIETPEGPFEACFSARGLVSLSFPDAASEVGDSDHVPTEWKCDTAAAVNDVLRGRAPRRLPPLDFSGGTSFQQKVWKALLQIPFGATQTYGEIAAAIGAPSAARAVGAACGANPIPVLVPCHRVLASDGKLGGFSAGLKWKRLLLERERASGAFNLPLSPVAPRNQRSL